MVRRPRAGDFERDGESGLLLPRRTIERAHPQYLGPPFFSGGGSDDPYASSVVLLMHGDGANGGTTFTDSSSYAHTVTAGGGAVTSTAQLKYGTASMLFASTADWLSVAESGSELRMGTSDFTIEGWFYTTASGSYKSFWLKGVNTTGGLQLFVDTTNLAFRANGTSDLTASGLSSSTWTHVAFCREGNTRRIYSGGVQVASDTLSFDNSDSGPLEVGAVPSSSSSFRYGGYIDELRATKGVCRYPSGTSFTPPSAAFPDP